MKNDDQEAVDLLRQMGRLVVPLLAPELELSRQERMTLSVHQLVEGLRAEPPQRRLPACAMGGFAAAAAAVALLFGAQRLLRAPPAPAGNEVAHVISVSGASTLLRVGSSARLLVAEQRVDAKDELLSTMGSRAELALTGAGKARVEVSDDTRVRLNQRLAGADAASEDWLELERGLVTLQVAKLPPGLELWVQTPDARVTVHGTRFSVRVTPRTPSGTVTVVAVTEGRVEVNGRDGVVFLGPGEHWSSQEATPGSAQGVDTGAAGQPQAVRTAAAPSKAAHSATPPVSERRFATGSARANQSTLAEENRLYAQAMARAGSGDVPPALAILANLIQSYPRSPLAQNARVDRFRLLQQTGNSSAAAQEARRYLSEYPSGFARTEARRLALLGLEAQQ